MTEQNKKVKMGTLYEANQKLMNSVDALSEKKLAKFQGDVGGWINFRSDKKYFMLLCNELRDYTIYHMDEFNCHECAKLAFENLGYRGHILSVDYNHAMDYYEFWVRTVVYRDKDGNLVGFVQKNDTDKSYVENHMYIFFNCDSLVCEV